MSVKQSWLEETASGLAETPDYAKILMACRTNFERYQVCKAMHEHYRQTWFIGRRQQIAILVNLPTRRLRARYGRLTLDRRQRYGGILWYKSTRARDLNDMQNMFERWTILYANACGVEVTTSVPGVPLTRAGL